MENSVTEESSHTSGKQQHTAVNAEVCVSTAVSKDRDDEDTREQYMKLQHSTLNDTDKTSNYGVLLLPSFIDSSSNVKIYVQGAKDVMTNIAARLCAEQYISNLSKERDEAAKAARSYRNQVDNLRSRNRKLYCDMNDKIDVIRNIWRNNIAEGSTRAGKCVQQAILRHKKV